MRDCNSERDTGFSGFTMQDSGNVVVNNGDPVTKTGESFHFDLTQLSTFSSTLSRAYSNRITCLIPPSSTGSLQMRESGTTVRRFLKRKLGIGIRQ